MPNPSLNIKKMEESRDGKQKEERFKVSTEDKDYFKGYVKINKQTNKKHLSFIIYTFKTFVPSRIYL